jgi:hypothetical protein
VLFALSSLNAECFAIDKSQLFGLILREMHPNEKCISPQRGCAFSINPQRSAAIVYS